MSKKEKKSDWKCEEFGFAFLKNIKTRPNKDQYSIYDMDNKQNP